MYICESPPVVRSLTPTSSVYVFLSVSPGYGMMTDGTTTFINASACTVNFLPMNPPIVFDLPNPRTTWLEEAGTTPHPANQEKGARGSRWGQQAEKEGVRRGGGEWGGGGVCKYYPGVFFLTWRTTTPGGHLWKELSEWVRRLSVVLCAIVSSSVTESESRRSSRETLLKRGQTDMSVFFSTDKPNASTEGEFQSSMDSALEHLPGGFFYFLFFFHRIFLPSHF